MYTPVYARINTGMGAAACAYDRRAPTRPYCTLIKAGVINICVSKLSH